MADNEDIEDSQFPDNDDNIPYVTGSNLPQKVGSKVMCWGFVTKISGGDSFYIKTVDDQEVLIKLQKPLNEPIEGWCEIHGISQGKNILCEDYVVFPPEMTQDIDKEGHKGLAKLLGVLDNPWHLGDSTNGGVAME